MATLVGEMRHAGESIQRLSRIGFRDQNADARFERRDSTDSLGARPDYSFLQQDRRTAGDARFVARWPLLRRHQFIARSAAPRRSDAKPGSLFSMRSAYARTSCGVCGPCAGRSNHSPSCHSRRLSAAEANANALRVLGSVTRSGRPKDIEAVDMVCFPSGSEPGKARIAVQHRVYTNYLSIGVCAELALCQIALRSARHGRRSWPDLCRVRVLS